MLMDSNGQRRISGICRALHFTYLGPRLLSVFELIIQDVVDCNDDKVVSQSVDGRGRGNPSFVHRLVDAAPPQLGEITASSHSLTPLPSLRRRCLARSRSLSLSRSRSLSLSRSKYLTNNASILVAPSESES